MFMKIISTGSKAGNCYALKDDNDNIYLLDFGCNEKKILNGIDFKFANVRAAFLTHVHGDHSKSHEWLLKNGVHIYTNPETAQALSPDSQFMHGVKEKQSIKVYGCIATPFYVPHTSRDSETGEIIPCPNFGWLLDFPETSERLLYCTDYEFIPYSFKSFNINYFLLECNHQAEFLDRSETKWEHSLRGHSELETVKKIVEVNKTPDMQNVILCHLSDGWSNEKVMQKEVQSVAGKWVNVAVAHAGDEYILSKYPWEV